MKRIFQKIVAFFQLIFGNVDKAIIDNLDDAISVANIIRSILQSPILGVIVKLTPTTWDDALVAKANSVLETVFQKLLAGQACADLQVRDERLTCYLKQLALLTPTAQNAMLMKIASLYAAATNPAAGKSESDYDTAVQMRFKEQKLDAAK